MPTTQYKPIELVRDLVLTELERRGHTPEWLARQLDVSAGSVSSVLDPDRGRSRNSTTLNLISVHLGFGDGFLERVLAGEQEAVERAVLKVQRNVPLRRTPSAAVEVPRQALPRPGPTRSTQGQRIARLEGEVRELRQLVHELTGNRRAAAS